jgi:4-amino-4-deoxy-L-arabinose transferase-like glycosyltransferase
VPLVVACALRLAVVPPRLELDVAPLIGDEGNYVGIAETIAQGAGIPDRWVWLRPPGFPLILAGLLRLFGRDLHAPMVLQALAGVLVVATVAAIAGQLWGRRAAIFATWATALNPSLIYYTRILHTETLYLACAMIAVLALVRYCRAEATARPLAVAAIFVGIAALLRPAIVAPLPLLILWLIGRRPRGEWRIAARHATLFVALFVATIAPNLVHNWLAYGRIIPLDTTLGYIFWLDHRDIPREQLIDTLAAIRNPGDRQQYALRQGLAWVAAHPVQTVTNSLSNLRIFWGEPPYVVDALERRRGVTDGWRATVHSLTLLAWLAIVPLAFVALGRSRRADPLIPIIVLGVIGPTIGVALSHHENRYLVPAVPPLIALAAGIVAARELTSRSRRRTFLIGTGILLFLLNLGLIGSPLAGERATIATHWLIAQGAARVGANDLAHGQYDAMGAVNPRLSGPDEGRAILAHRQGDDDTALAAARRALAIDQENFRARALAAALLRDRGQSDDARRVARFVTIAPQLLAWAWDHPTAPPAARVVLDGTDVGFTRGFYGAEEGEGGRAFRWMAEDGQIRLAAPPVGRAATLVLALASPRPPEVSPVEVGVRANDRHLGVVTVRREQGWNEIRLPLPADLDPTQPLVIDLHTTAIDRPDDRREFGVAVAAATIAIGP